MVTIIMICNFHIISSLFQTIQRQTWHHSVIIHQGYQSHRCHWKLCPSPESLLALCCPSVPSTAGQSGIRRFVDTELNRWHQQCRQTGRQAKQFYISLHHHWTAHTHPSAQRDRNSFLKMAALQVKLFVPIVTSPRPAKRNNKTALWRRIM